MYLKFSVFVVGFFFFSHLNSFSQSAGVAINTDGSAPHSSAILDVNSTNKGFLIPRVNLTGLNDNSTISSAAIGLIVYNSATAGSSPNEVNPGIYYWTGSSWTRLNNNSNNITANNGLTLSGNTIGLGGILNGATDIAQAGNDFRFTGSGNVGIGVSGTPSQKLHVNGAVRAESGFVANDGSLSTPAFHFESDTDVGLYRAGADILGLVTNGTERLRINATGVVSISNLSTNGIVRTTGGTGTLSSSGGLINLASEVTGTLPVANGGTGATTLTGVLKGNGTSPITAMTGTANYVTRWTDANTIGTGIIRDNNARVGIGVDPDATQILKVGGRMMVDDGVIQRGGAAITGTSDLGLYSRNNGNWMRYVTNNAQHAWFTDDGVGTTPRMVLDASGNLSVPTTLNGTGNRTVYADAGGVLKAQAVATSNNSGVYFTSSNTFVVPTGVYTITVSMWGAGGGSGYFCCSNNTGQGGTGSYLYGTINVTPGELLSITIGAGGAVSTGGVGGGGTQIRRGSTILAAAAGGGGGSYNNAATIGRGGGSQPTGCLNNTGNSNGGNGSTGSGNGGCGGTVVTSGMASVITNTNGFDGNTANANTAGFAPPGTSNPFYLGNYGYNSNKSSGNSGGGGLLVISW